MPFQHSGNGPKTSTNWEVLMHEKLWSLRHSYQHLLLSHLLLPLLRKWKSLGCVWLFTTPWTIAHLAFPVLYSLLEFAQTHVHWVSDAIQPSHPLSSPSLSAFSLSQQWISSFPLSQFFASDGQSIGVSASASVIPMNIQGWFPLGLTGLISLLPMGLSNVFSSTTFWKHNIDITYIR